MQAYCHCKVCVMDAAVKSASWMLLGGEGEAGEQR